MYTTHTYAPTTHTCHIHVPYVPYTYIHHTICTYIPQSHTCTTHIYHIHMPYIPYTYTQIETSKLKDYEGTPYARTKINRMKTPTLLGVPT